MKEMNRFSLHLILWTISFFSFSCGNNEQDMLELPMVETLSADSIGNVKAYLNANINSNGKPITIEFEYGTTTTYDSLLKFNQIITSTTKISVSEKITGLISGQTYHYRVVGETKYEKIFGDDVTFTTTIKDGDGNDYGFVTIGNQTWLKENLKTTKLRGGNTIIPCVTDIKEWHDLTTSGYCWYNNDPKNKDIYGALYNWYAVNTERLCPTGWHAPSDDEWYRLLLALDPSSRNYYGPESDVAGGMLKETGTAHWLYPNTNASNVSGFTALPSGIRNYTGEFTQIGQLTSWWSHYIEATHITPSQLMVVFSRGDVKYYPKSVGPFGLSVRCIRDN